MATAVTLKELNLKFAELKSILKQIKSAKGTDLYSHLQEVVSKLILHYPNQAYDKLEEVSYLLKHQDTLRTDDFLKLEDFRNYQQVCREMDGYCTSLKYQFGARKPAVDGEDDADAEPEEVPPVGQVPDLLADSQIYQWAGIGFGQQEMYRLQKSLKQLATDSGAGKLRFFGKIRGTEKDYYIAEGEIDGEDDGGDGDERPADFEPKGTGVNRFTYWVSHQSFDTWTQLPDLAPKDVEAARKIKVLFSGDLNRTIYTNPFFFKSEKEYLRAQIARISHSTTLCPTGLFRLQEDSTREIEENAPEEGDIVKPSTREMSSPGMWCHHTVGILKNNRTAHMEPDVPEDQEIEPEELMKQIEAADPFEPRLKPITSDTKVVVSKSQKIQPWVVRLMGDQDEYVSESGKRTCNGVVVVRSLQWPGAFNFYFQERYESIYVGDGHKYEEQTYFPIHPPTVNDDPKEYEQQPEPTPLESPRPEEN